MAPVAQKTDFIERPFVTPPPVVTLIAGSGEKVAPALLDRTGILYIARHDAHAGADLRISVGIDPGGDRAAFDETVSVLGPPTWVAILEMHDPLHRQGLLALLHQRLRCAGFAPLGEPPLLMPFALVQYNSLRAWAGSTLVALASLGFLPRNTSAVALLTGRDAGRVLDKQLDPLPQKLLWHLGEDVHAARLDSTWVLLPGSLVSNHRRFAQEPRRSALIQEDIFTGVLVDTGMRSLEVVLPLLFESLDDISDYTFGDLKPSVIWTQGTKESLACGRF